MDTNSCRRQLKILLLLGFDILASTIGYVAGGKIFDATNPYATSIISNFIYKCNYDPYTRQDSPYADRDRINTLIVSFMVFTSIYLMMAPFEIYSSVRSRPRLWWGTWGIRNALLIGMLITGSLAISTKSRCWGREFMIPAIAIMGGILIANGVDRIYCLYRMKSESRMHCHQQMRIDDDIASITAPRSSSDGASSASAGLIAKCWEKGGPLAHTSSEVGHSVERHGKIGEKVVLTTTTPAFSSMV